MQGYNKRKTTSVTVSVERLLIPALQGKFYRLNAESPLLSETEKNRRRKRGLGRFTTFRGVGDGFGGRKVEDRGELEQRQAGTSEMMIDGIARFTNVIENAENESRRPTVADFIGEGFTADECAAF